MTDESFAMGGSDDRALTPGCKRARAQIDAASRNRPPPRAWPRQWLAETVGPSRGSAWLGDRRHPVVAAGLGGLYETSRLQAAT